MELVPDQDIKALHQLEGFSDVTVSKVPHAV